MSSNLVTSILSALQTVIDTMWTTYSLSGSPPTLADTNGALSAMFDTTLSHVVDLSSAVSDYDLAVGETAVINFTNATSVPLHITAGDGRLFEVTSKVTQGTYAQGALSPNNTTYTNMFYYTVLYSNGGTTHIAPYENESAFRMRGAGIARYLISTSTAMKTLSVLGNDITSLTVPDFGLWSITWNDTTTVWSSLGTVSFGSSASSGVFVVRRIA